MDFQLTETAEQITEMIRDFGKAYIQPHVMEWDEQQVFPVDMLKGLGRLGLMGVLVPEEYGGSGMGYPEYVTVISEISKFCGGVGLSVAAHNSLCTGHILQFGSEDQKKK